jgi:hopanoid biosynthesis associated RND transporter like protein HpnN
VAFVLSLTVLPALLMLLKPRGEADEVGSPRLAVADHFLQRHRKPIAIVAAILAVGGAALLTQLHFDFNPLHLRNPKSESVATLLDLMKDPLNAPNTIDILAPSLDAAEKTQAKLSALPEVAQVLTLKSFIPDDQDAKLALISDAAMLLDTTINPFFEAPPPSDAETVAALRNTVTHLRKAAVTAKGPASADALNLAAVLERLANGSKDTRVRAGEIMVPPLKTMLAQVRNILQARKITLDTMPKDMVRDWIAPDGRARIQVFPSGNADSNANLRNFARAVRAIAPDATGAAISIQESGNTIVGAFTKAGIGSFIAVTILLFIALRRVRVVAMAVASLVLAGILTMASCVVLGLQINFANIIALPLLFGIGVAFNIYYLMAWRGGDAGLLQSPLARAILFSALTTASGFGSLWLSSHPGTASMGELLMLSLAWTIISTLFFLPSFLGPAPQKGAKS